MPAAPDRIAEPDRLLTPPISAVLAALNDGEVETRLVGGAVRNHLLGLSPGDIDLATTAMPDDVMRHGAAAGFKAVPTGIDHGTVTLIAEGLPVEVTTLRADIETDGRRAVVTFGTDWAGDALRRDFTMNALYVDADGRLYDPVGGYDDVISGRVRFIGDAETRIREDYLRILRFFRFHARFGRGMPDTDGLRAAIRLRAGLDGLSAERVQQELLKLVTAPGAVAALDVMANAGLLTRVLGGVGHVPSVAALAAIETAQGVAADPVPRLAALAVRVEEDARRLTARLRLSNAMRDRLVAMARFWPSLLGKTRPAADPRLLLYRLDATAYRDVVLLAWALAGATPDEAGWWARFRLPETWPVPVFPLKGRDVIAAGVAPGPQVAAALTRLEADWIASDFALSAEDLLSRL